MRGRGGVEKKEETQGREMDLCFFNRGVGVKLFFSPLVATPPISAYLYPPWGLNTRTVPRGEESKNNFFFYIWENIVVDLLLLTVRGKGETTEQTRQQQPRQEAFFYFSLFFLFPFLF